MGKKINITELKWENGRIYKNDICNIKWYVQDDSLIDKWGKHLTEIYKAKDISEMKFTEIETHLLDCDVDWTKIPTDTKILVSSDGKTWHHAYFAKYENNMENRELISLKKAIYVLLYVGGFDLGKLKLGDNSKIFIEKIIEACIKTTDNNCPFRLSSCTNCCDFSNSECLNYDSNEICDHIHQEVWKHFMDIEDVTDVADSTNEDGLPVVWDGLDEDAIPYCGGCDSEINEDWTYCPSCGIKILMHGRDID